MQCENVRCIFARPSRFELEPSGLRREEMFMFKFHGIVVGRFGIGLRTHVLPFKDRNLFKVACEETHFVSSAQFSSQTIINVK